MSPPGRPQGDDPRPPPAARAEQPPVADADDQALGRLARRALAELPDAPAAWVASAIALWPAAQAQAAVQALPAWLGGLRRVLATLRFDSAAQPALALGMRGGPAGVRQLLFSAEGYDLDLRLAPEAAGPGWRLDGQVLGPEGPMRVALTTAPAEADRAADPALSGLATAGQEAEVDELGEFHFQGLETGCWRLQLCLPQLLVDLPAIELRPPPGRPGRPG